VIRTIWTYLIGALATVFFGCMAILVAYLGPGPGARICDWAPRAWGKTILWAAGVKVKLVGMERLDRGRPQIVVSNHQSWFDVFTLAAYLPVRFRFVAKKELARIPIYGRAWRACGHVSVDRGDRSAAIESLSQASGEVKDLGLTMVMFPEGTRSPTGELQRFKKGAFVLAIQLQIPLVPLGIVGSRAIMRKGHWRVKSGEITVNIGDPISSEGLTIRDRDSLLTDSHAAVAALTEGNQVGPESPALRR
jgi:1-acyl-sn-glycerol-3-phosphate acyltransferase